jgi:hypothetical protein
MSGFLPTFNGASKRSSNKLRNLDYDKIPIQKIQFLLIVFYGDVLLNCCLSFPIFMAFQKCKAWIERMMAMLGVR